jgi:hypothetical protein
VPEPSQSLPPEAPPGRPDSVTRPASALVATLTSSPPTAQTVERAAAAPPPPAKAPWVVATIASVAAAGAAAAAWRLSEREIAPTAPQRSLSAEATAAPVVPAPSASAPAFPEATVGVRAIIAGDALDAKEVERMAATQLDGVRRCYEGGLAREASLGGRYVVLVGVYAEGLMSPNETPPREVDEADWVDRVMTDTEVRTCIRQELGKWRFPKHERVPLVGVLLAFELQPRPSEGPPAREVEPAYVEEYSSSFDYSFQKTQGPDPPTPARLARVGDMFAIEYEGGGAGCMVFQRDESLTCRWAIHDSTGGATLRKEKNGYKGPWGTWPSDSDGGIWSLTLKPKKPG